MKKTELQNRNAVEVDVIVIDDVKAEIDFEKLFELVLK